CHALLEEGSEEAVGAAVRGLRWLEPLQVLDVPGDWAVTRPGVRPGGWAFQYANPHYVDLDDTAVVVMAMDRAARLMAGDGRTAPEPTQTGPVFTSPRGGESLPRTGSGVGSRSEPGEAVTITDGSQRPEPPHPSPLSAATQAGPAFTSPRGGASLPRPDSGVGSGYEPGGGAAIPDGQRPDRPHPTPVHAGKR